MKTLRVRLNDGALWVCDMRPGISQDGISVNLSAGIYRCEAARAEETGLSTISYIRECVSPTSEERIGELSLDMARLGVVELRPLLAKHRGDWEALADWSDEASGAREKEWGGHLEAGKLHAVFFSIGSDCTVEVLRLRRGRRTVGMRIRPKERLDTAAKPQRWTWVEVKLRGIGDPWSFCDDWAFTPDDELIFDNIDLELSDFTNDEVDHSAPLSKYCASLRGVASISAFVEDSGKPRRPITRLLQIPKLGASPTAKRLAATVLSIFEQARKRA